MVQRRQRNPSTRIRTAAIIVTVGVFLLSILFAQGLQDLAQHLTSSFESEETGTNLAQASIPRMLKPVKSLFASYWGRPATTASVTASSTSQTANLNNRISQGMASKAPVYFVSHGVSTCVHHFPLPFSWSCTDN